MLKLRKRKTKKILKEVLNERKNQHRKWGEQNHSPDRWSSIFGEEAGEVHKAICERDWENYREELIQVAAVAVQMVECYDRNK